MPRPALISREQILDATLAVADEEGLAAVTMRRVAARVGVTAMSLYHHVRDKDDLLDGLVERLLAELVLPEPGLSGEERLHGLAISLRQAAARHPDAFSLLLRRPVATEAALAVREVVYAALRDAGVPDDLVPRTERLISTFVIGFAASEVGGRFAAHDEAVRDADFEWAWRHLSGRLSALTPEPAGAQA
ncbi:MAG TPA: TetR family transcriptional regulator [Solirubrobacteraceae bacterium]|nr:TetR family transcriptional regulator [Solirubrobacteraceae bacterium]